MKLTADGEEWAVPLTLVKGAKLVLTDELIADALRKGKAAEREARGETEPVRDYAPKSKAKQKPNRTDIPRPKQSQLDRAKKKRSGSDEGE